MTVNFTTWKGITDGQRYDIPDSALTQKANHYWPFDEGSGSTVHDNIGEENGDISGPTWESGVGFGNAYLDFDGVDDIITYPQLIDGSSVVISTWCIHDGSSGQYLTHQDVADGVILWTGTGDDEWNLTAGGESMGSVAAPVIDEWVMVTAVVDGDTVELYHNDGNLIGDDTSGRSYNFSGSFEIGDRSTDNDRPWESAIDQPLVILGDTVTASEIEDHYNETKDLYE